MFKELAAEDKSGIAHSYLGGFNKHGWTIEIYKQGAALGNTTCMSNLGLMLHKGEERHRDLPEAIRLFRAAAALGCAHGANNAAVFLLDQNGNYSDPEGWAFLKQAADQEESDACFSFFLLQQRYGVMHLVGRYLLKCLDSADPASELEEDAKMQAVRLKESNPDALVPYGLWEPWWKVHKWVSPTIWREMRAVLMMQIGVDMLWRALPRDIALEICFWLCTFPRPEHAKNDMSKNGS